MLINIRTKSLDSKNVGININDIVKIVRLLKIKKQVENVPYVQEIVSNEASAKVREIEIKGQKFLLRKPRTVITEENYRVLQFLDYLADFDKYMDGSVEDIPARLVQIIKDENITKKVIDAYISLYPTKVYKNLYVIGVVYAIA